MLLDELKTHLVSEGITVDIFTGRLPDHPHACVSLLETGGLAPEMGFGSPGIQYETPGVQVLCRGEEDSYETPRTTAEAVFDVLTQIQAQELSGVFYHTVNPQQSPALLGLDDQKRPRIVFNVLCEKAPS